MATIVNVGLAGGVDQVARADEPGADHADAHAIARGHASERCRAHQARARDGLEHGAPALHGCLPGSAGILAPSLEAQASFCSVEPPGPLRRISCPRRPAARS